MFSTLVHLALNLWLKVPFGYVCRIHHKDAHMTLRKDFWVVFTNGNTTDTLPVTVISHHLQHEFAMRMKDLGYHMDAFFDKHTHAPVAPSMDISLRDPSGRIEPYFAEEKPSLGEKQY